MIMMKSKIRTYSELCQMHSFEDRFRYLKLDGKVGRDTFGFDRYLNQNFYKSKEWKDVRDKVIVRDNACDLGVQGHDIPCKIYIHHMNPISPEDFENNPDNLLNPEYLICVSAETHNALHYGDEAILKAKELIERSPNDTIPWR